MRGKPNSLVSGHLDDSLSQDEQAELNNWLQESPSNRKSFVNAVLMHQRIAVHYQSVRAMRADTGSLPAQKPVAVRSSHRQYFRVAKIVTGTLLCLMIAMTFFLREGFHNQRSKEAYAEFHQLVLQGRTSGDRTYQVSFVKDPFDKPGSFSTIVADDPQRLSAAAVVNEAVLHVRDGREFLYSWKTHDGNEFLIGGNSTNSWAIRPGTPLQVGDPLQFTGGLPAGLYLAPILSFFEGQERMLSSHYDIELRSRDSATQVFVAMKKPDTKQGPRRIEIDFASASRSISKMRIWPATPDHRRTNHTLIKLVSEKQYAADFFTPEYHAGNYKGPRSDTAGIALFEFDSSGRSTSGNGMAVQFVSSVESTAF